MDLHGTRYSFNILIIAVVATGILGSCLDPFPLPDVSSGFLVVEGTFTDDSSENRIRLTFAGQVNETPTWVQEARVTVSDDQGNSEPYYHSGQGFYSPYSEDFIGVPGREYMLRIELRDGRIYQSDRMLLREAVPIEDLGYETVQAPSPDGTEWWNGVQFYLDTRDPTNENRYFLWKYLETYETVVPSPIRDIHLGGGEFESVYNTNRCYRIERSKDIMVQSTADQVESEIRSHPIVFVPSNTVRLWRHYRIGVTQFSLPEGAYIYHQKLQTITGQTGTIFDQQPYTLRGNVRNMNDPDEIVMGYFIVSAVSKKSVDIRLGDLEWEYWGVNYHLRICRDATREYGVTPYFNYNYFFNRVLPRWGMQFVGLIYDDSSMADIPPVVALELAPSECTTCEGTMDKPLDWDDWD